MELLRITRHIHCKAVEQRATLIHRQYNRDWGTSYSRPAIDPYLTFPLLQNLGGTTGCGCANAFNLDARVAATGCTPNTSSSSSRTRISRTLKLITWRQPLNLAVLSIRISSNHRMPNRRRSPSQSRRRTTGRPLSHRVRQHQPTQPSECYRHCPCRIYETVQRPSVRPSVCLSVPSIDSSSGGFADG